MLSGLLSHFGLKQKPNFSPATIERVRWYVLHPLHSVDFEDKAWGLTWCEQHGFATADLKTHVAKINAEDAIAKDNVLNNMFDRIKEGHYMGSPLTVPANTPAKHLDKFFEHFVVHKDIASTAPLLAMAFTINRIDVAHYLGDLLEQAFSHWEHPLDSIPYQDPDIVQNANKAFLEGFKELMATPRQMQWLMQHNPTLLEKITRPENWSKLESSIVNFAQDKEKVRWPLVAAIVFNQYTNPVSSHWPIGHPDLFNTLLLSFAHDPAAQCSLINQAKKTTWFYNHESMMVPLSLASPFVAPESIVLRQHFRQEQIPTGDPHLDTRVAMLEMVLSDNLSDAEFYQHARAVLSPAPTMQLDLPDLDLAAP